MCGPSGEQTSIAGQQQTLGSTLAANYQTNYAAQGNILNELNQELSPISQAGPEQQGYGANERAALQTEATTGVSSNYNKAATALNMSTRGSVPAAAARAYQQQLATNAAKESADLTRANTVANYNTGRANFANATAGVNALAQTYAPTQTAQVAGTGLGTAYQSATTNAQAGAQEFGEIAGGVAALAGAGAQYAKGFQKGPSETGNADTNYADANSFTDIMYPNAGPPAIVPPENNLLPNYGPPQ